MYSHYVDHAGSCSMTVMPAAKDIDQVLQVALAAAKAQAQAIAMCLKPEPEMHRAFKQGPPRREGEAPTERFVIAFEVINGSVRCRDCPSFPSYYFFT